MSRKITVEQLKQLVHLDAQAFEYLGHFVEFDTDSPIPRLKVRADALLDPESLGDYDVDQAIFERTRELEKGSRTRSLRGLDDRTRVVAEGDSWFRHVRALRPRSIAQVLQKRYRRRMDVDNQARWGHTLEQMLRDKEYIPAIEAHRAEYFVFSGGGNDFVDGIWNFIHRYELDRPVDEYLTPEGQESLDKIGAGYRVMLDDVTSNFPELEILCYGYDYPRPLVAGGFYIGKHLRANRIPDELMSPVLAVAMRKMNEIIKAETEPYDRVSFIDCLGETESYTWLDDMHPGKRAFRHLASLFAEEILS